MKPYFTRLAAPFRRQLDAAVFLGVRSICSYMGIGPSTFYMWTKRYSFPATRTPDGRWMTSAALIDSWLRDRLMDSAARATSGLAGREARPQ
jgi:predicted DNA-binding transcriptional regulator AlpA